jgi:hypothetical protein
METVINLSSAQLAQVEQIQKAEGLQDTSQVFQLLLEAFDQLKQPLTDSEEIEVARALHEKIMTSRVLIHSTVKHVNSALEQMEEQDRLATQRSSQNGH